MYPLSVKQTYLAVFNSSASSAAVPGLATDPFSILLGARRSTQVTPQTNCLPSSHGARGWAEIGQRNGIENQS